MTLERNVSNIFNFAPFFIILSASEADEEVFDFEFALIEKTSISYENSDIFNTLNNLSSKYKKCVINFCC